jgi:tetratricopeptide (TPR) repeat protein
MTPRRSLQYLCRLRTAILALALCTLPATVATGQGLTDFTATSSVRGEATSPEPGALRRLSVQLWRSEEQRMVDSQRLSLHGRFEFYSIPHGNYEVRVTDDAGTVLRRTFVMVASGPAFVQLDLPGRPREDRPVSGFVSVTALRHKPPARARREYERAWKAHDKGDIAKEIESLRKAVAIDPAYAEAYNALGVAYLTVGKRQEAYDTFAAGVHLDAASPILQSNLALAHVALGRFADAEKPARTSLRLNPAANNTRFVLGIALAGQRRDDQETLDTLAAAAREYPQARLLAAHVLVRLGEKTRAVTELKKYLSSGIDRDRQDVENWVAKLSQ